jgi:site-specific recombinase XerD
MGRVIDGTLFDLFHDFFKVYLPSQKNSSKHTIRAYRYAVNSFLDFIKDEKQIELYQITLKMVNSKALSAYLDSLEKQGNSISTRNHRRNCIRAFCAYAAKTEPLAVSMTADIHKVPKKKGDTAVVEYMPQNAIEALLAAPDSSSKLGLRDQFMMIMFYDTGARIQEILDLRLCDIKTGKFPTATLHGKNSKTRTVPLMEKTVIHFQNYCTAYHQDSDPYSTENLFYVSRYGIKKRMCEDNVRKRMRKYAEVARKDCCEVPVDIHPHLWRHSRAMHLYQNGMDLTLVAQWLGHSRLDTTLIYAHADTEQKRQAIEKATTADSPLARHLNSDRYTVTDDETLRRLYGLR